MQARVSAAFLAALLQTASVRVLSPLHLPRAEKKRNQLTDNGQAR
jgi:hypothetical protein